MAQGDEPQVVGRYAIYDRIAAGAMASVHFGRLLATAGFSRTVAVKRLHRELVGDPEFQATLIDEARLAARIHHPNVAQTLDVVAAEGELLVVMEYIRGESLARLVRGEKARGRRVPVPITSAILVGTLAGLHAAHEATSDRGEPLGLVHRDVSPQNILVGIDGMARVIDFGVAKAAGRLQTTEAGVVKGKVAYMSPEQLVGRPVTRATDIYAAAVVLWEALAGARLFEADGDGAIARKVFAGATEPPSARVPGIPPELDAVVMRGLSTDPAARYATARDMAQAIQRVAPPAFPSDVAEWCLEVAGDALAKRAALLAEIESSSGEIDVAPAPANARPAVGPRGTMPPLPRSPSSAGIVASQPAEADLHDFDVDVPISLADPSLPGLNRSRSRPAPPGSPASRSRSTVLAAAAGAGLLATGLAIGLLARGGGGPTDTASSAATAQPAVSSSAMPPRDDPDSSSAPPAAPSASPAPPPAASTRPQALPAPTPPPRPRPGCTPPYVVDSKGVRHYKASCL